MPNWIDEADFMLAVARGTHKDYKGVNKFGFNLDVDTGTAEDIWDTGGTYVYPTVARIHDIVSSDGEDDGVATGTLTLASAVAIEFALGTIQSISPVAIEFATGTIQSVSPVANTFATGTCTLTAVAATDTCTINGLIYLAVSGAVVEGEFDIDGDDDADAVDLARAINVDTRSGTSGDISATSTNNVVTVTTDVAGTAGNAITLTTQDAQIVVSGSGTLTNGVTADITTVNGLIYTAITGSKAGDFTLFSIDVSDDATATDLADSITQDGRSGSLNDVTAVSATDTVTCTQTVGGTGGNATTLTSSDEAGRLNISGNTFTGGVNADTATVNGLIYTAVAGAKANDTEFTVAGGDTAVATDLADSIDDDVRAGVLDDVTAISATDTVTITQTVGGTGGNATTLASSDEAGRLTISGSVFTGGVNADVATVNGLTYTAISGDKGGDNTLFDIDGSDTVDAADLADSINNDIRTGITEPTAVVVAVPASAVVTINVDGGVGDLVDIAGTANITASDTTLENVDVGANTLLIEGLDANFAEITEIIALNGDTVVPTTQAYLRINRMIVLTAGTDGQNNGIITATAQTDSTVSASIAIGANQTNMCIYAVPAGKTAFVVNISISVGKLLETEIDSQLVVRPENQVFQIKSNLGVNSTGSSNGQLFFKPYLLVPEKSDIKIQASTSTDSVSVSAGFDLILVDN